MAYSEAAWERAMKVQEVIMKARNAFLSSSRHPRILGVRGPLARGTSQRRILCRSRHLPSIPFAGSRTWKINKTGVRLWIDPSIDENREVGGHAH
jgi:hypothetical protein